MKKKMLAFFALIICVSLVLSGCGAGKKSLIPDSEYIEDAQMTVTISDGSAYTLPEGVTIHGENSSRGLVIAQKDSKYGVYNLATSTMVIECTYTNLTDIILLNSYGLCDYIALKVYEEGVATHWVVKTETGSILFTDENGVEEKFKFVDDDSYPKVYCNTFNDLYYEYWHIEDGFNEFTRDYKITVDGTRTLLFDTQNGFKKGDTLRSGIDYEITMFFTPEIYAETYTVGNIEYFTIYDINTDKKIGSFNYNTTGFVAIFDHYFVIQNKTEVSEDSDYDIVEGSFPLTYYKVTTRVIDLLTCKETTPKNFNYEISDNSRISEDCITVKTYKYEDKIISENPTYFIFRDGKFTQANLLSEIVDIIKLNDNRYFVEYYELDPISHATSLIGQNIVDASFNTIVDLSDYTFYRYTNNYLLMENNNDEKIAAVDFEGKMLTDFEYDAVLLDMNSNVILSKTKDGTAVGDTITEYYRLDAQAQATLIAIEEYIAADYETSYYYGATKDASNKVEMFAINNSCYYIVKTNTTNTTKYDYTFYRIDGTVIYTFANIDAPDYEIHLMDFSQDVNYEKSTSILDLYKGTAHNYAKVEITYTYDK